MTDLVERAVPSDDGPGADQLHGRDDADEKGDDDHDSGTGQGLFTAYAAPQNRFDSEEKTMRTIIGSFALDPQQVRPTPTSS